MTYLIWHYKIGKDRPDRFDQQVVDQLCGLLECTLFSVLTPPDTPLLRAGAMHAPAKPKDPDALILNDDVVVIQDATTKKYWIIDWQDPAHFTAQFGHGERFAGATVAMYHMNWIAQHVPAFHRVRAGIYSSLYPDVARQAFKPVAQPSEQRDPRLFFSGTIGDEDGIDYQNPDGLPRRQAVRILQKLYPDGVVIWDRTQKRPRDQWLREAKKYRLNLALAGHPHCSRENDLFAAGLPVLMPEMLNNTSVEMRPNEHYVAAPAGSVWSSGASVDPLQLADNIWRTYEAVVDDYAFLDRIGENARRYWYREIDPAAAAHRIIEQIEWDMMY